MQIISTIITIIIFIFPLTSYADTHAAADCAYATVASAVSAADDGDTVTVPACEETTWATVLEINKAIILQGNGVDSTNIKAGIGDEDSKGMIYYNPTTPNTDHRFRVTGFTLNTDNLANGIWLQNSGTMPETIRIDHNKFTNLGNTGGTRRGVYINGTFYGVIDNNNFSVGNGKAVDSYGNSGTSWSAFGDTETRISDLGTADNIYIEDNILSTTLNTYHSGGSGGRFVIRYNTYTSSVNLTPIIDMHGGQTSSYGGLIGEIYGNKVTFDSGKGAGLAWGQRGGIWMTFYNQIVDGASSASSVKEEAPEDLFPEANSYEQNIRHSYYWVNFKDSSTIMPQTANVYNGCYENAAWQAEYDYYNAHTSDIGSYYSNYFGTANCFIMNSRSGVSPYTTGTIEPTWASVSPGSVSSADGDYTWLNLGPNFDPIVENVNWWTQRSGAFDGTGDSSSGGGVGCGTLASRPATCTTGVGYWATTQSCSDLTGMVGASAATPISGTLYKCTATDTWTSYYTPYAYPHPLRNETSQQTLTLTVNGSGTCTVTSFPAGIDSASSTTHDFEQNTEVTMTVSATSPNYFAGWSGTGGCTGTGSCVMTMSAAKAATATCSRYGVGTIGAGGQITFGSGGSMTLQ